MTSLRVAPGLRSRLRALTPRQLWALATLAAIIVVVVAPQWLAGGDPYDLTASDRFLPPSLQHPFGTDEGGRDIFTRVVHGARLSLGTAVAVVAFAAVFGTVVGATSGWLGGMADRVLMKVVDVGLAFPYLVLAMAIAASLGRGVGSAVVALALVWWPSYARMIRGMVLSIKEDLHVRAARTLGASTSQILWWHVIPHTLPQLNARVSLDIGYAVIAMTGLSFLGLGAQNPSPEWGLMIANAKGFVFSAWWYAVFPGVAIFVTVLNFVGLGDSLAEGRS